AEDGIRDRNVTGVQTCALPISQGPSGRLLLGSGEVASVGGQRVLASSFLSISGYASFAPLRRICGIRVVLFSHSHTLRGRFWARSEERRVGKECRSRVSCYESE